MRIALQKRNRNKKDKPTRKSQADFQEKEITV
jgi:hypothetical protein